MSVLYFYKRYDVNSTENTYLKNIKNYKLKISRQNPIVVITLFPRLYRGYG